MDPRISSHDFIVNFHDQCSFKYLPRLRDDGYQPTAVYDTTMLCFVELALTCKAFPETQTAFL